jgi:myo-inositol-1(or 4)-monophosphatase
MRDPAEIGAFIREILLDAGIRVRAARPSGGRVSFERKGVRDLVTAVDRDVESFIISAIHDRFPGDAILGEESRNELASPHGPLWIIDPVDGTTNFAHGLHAVGISLAYAEDLAVLAAGVYAPFLNEMYHAVKGAGAWAGDLRLHAAPTTELSDALIATGFPYDRRDTSRLAKNLESVLRVTRDVRRIGAASLDICWVARGVIDGYYESVKPWDMAAGRLIAIEAGARAGRFGAAPVSSTLGEELSGENFLVAAPGIFDALNDLLV